MTSLGLKGVIFHDGLSSDYMAKLSTVNITFQETELNGRSVIAIQLCILYLRVYLTHRSTNDARFYIWRDYLRSNANIGRLFVTDISGMVFVMMVNADRLPM